MDWIREGATIHGRLRFGAANRLCAAAPQGLATVTTAAHSETQLLHLCTIANDPAQYAAMRASFEAAGFTSDVCRYTLFDNGQGNRVEPYGAINSALADTTEPYLIFCHQDVLCDQGQGFADLVHVLAELDARDPDWAVAGNVGFTARFKPVECITDPGNRGLHPGNLPVRVSSLDENFLVLKTAARVGCSPELSGFHLYATDLCLNARLKRKRAYVIDFRIRHLSAGNARSESFETCRALFVRRWSRELAFACIVTPSTKLLLSRCIPVGIADRLVRQERLGALIRFCASQIRRTRALFSAGR